MYNMSPIGLQTNWGKQKFTKRFIYSLIIIDSDKWDLQPLTNAHIQERKTKPAFSPSTLTEASRLVSWDL